MKKVVHVILDWGRGVFPSLARVEFTPWHGGKTRLAEYTCSARWLITSLAGGLGAADASATDAGNVSVADAEAGTPDASAPAPSAGHRLQKALSGTVPPRARTGRLNPT